MADIAYTGRDEFPEGWDSFSHEQKEAWWTSRAAYLVEQHDRRIQRAKDRREASYRRVRRALAEAGRSYREAARCTHPETHTTYESESEVNGVLIDESYETRCSNSRCGRLVGVPS